MRRAGLALLALVLAAPVAAAGPGPGSIRCEARRVRISLGFGGEELLFFGRVPEGTRAVAVVVEAPSRNGLRLMEKGRVGPFWFGVRQYRLDGVPGLYQVLLSCPDGNVLHPCRHPLELAGIERALAPAGVLLGPDALAARAAVETLQGKPDTAAIARLLEGFWRLQERGGLYRVAPNAVRINRDGQFYGRVPLPARAPEGKYTVTAHFLGEGALLGSASTELFVRRSGLVAWLSRLAERRAALYGSITVLVALAAGWLAGAIFGRHTSH